MKMKHIIATMICLCFVSPAFAGENASKAWNDSWDHKSPFAKQVDLNAARAEYGIRKKLGPKVYDYSQHQSKYGDTYMDVKKMVSSSSTNITGGIATVTVTGDNNDSSVLVEQKSGDTDKQNAAAQNNVTEEGDISSNSPSNN